MSKDTTQTNGNVTEAYIEAMERTGFYRNGRPTPGVIEDVIPIELISFIYEMFIHSSNSRKAREHSTYYTPINLVDLVLSEIFKQLPADANVLDLSCGSGVFLVESLRRLVACRVASDEE